MPIICDRCRGIPLDLFYQNHLKYQHSDSFHKLEASARNGCAGCRMLVDSFNRPSEDRFLRKSMPVVLYHDSIFASKSSNMRCGRIYRQFSCAINSVSSPDVVWGRKGCLAPFADSPKNIQLMRALISNCRKYHSRCRNNRASLYPTRLLYIGDDRENTIVRIVSVEDRSAYTWVALSHCWGRTEEDAPWKLTKARVQQYTAEIPWNLMPRTFQEAIEISRALGERYLWIDSLCIIQDSKEDWSIQSSAMCDIYSNSVVTISTATSSVHEGCIVARSPEDVVPVKFDLSSSRGSIYLYPPLPPDRNAVEAAPVSTRAWCLQESEISMRTIQFTTHQWIWTCNQIKCNEVDLIERDSHILSIHSAVDFTSILNVRREPEPPGLSFGPVSLNFESSTLWIPRHNYIEWYRKMEEYSRRNITYPKDRLPALIGLAERRGEFIPSSYAAGLWEADILYGLQWHPVNKVEKRILPEMAPSWSCVTLNAPISFAYETMRTEPATESSQQGSAHLVPTIKIVPEMKKIQTVFRHGCYSLLVQGRIRKAICSPILSATFAGASLRFAAVEKDFDTNSSRKWLEVTAGWVRFDTVQDATDCKSVSCLDSYHGVVAGSADRTRISYYK